MRNGWNVECGMALRLVILMDMTKILKIPSATPFRIRHSIQSGRHAHFKFGDWYVKKDLVVAAGHEESAAHFANIRFKVAIGSVLVVLAGF